MSFKQEHDKAERDWIKYLRTLDTKDLAKELYKKHKRTVDEVCEYLRHRSWIDGIQQYSKKKPSYKWWGFKHFIAGCCEHSVHNYYGLVFDKDGLKGDSIFTDFYAAYASRPKGYWQYNTMELYLLVRYFKLAYMEHGDKKRDFVDDVFAHHLNIYHLKRSEVKQDGQMLGYWEQIRDDYFVARELTIKKEFAWKKRSRSQYKKDRKRELKAEKKFLKKTYLSEQAIKSAVKNFIVDDRFTFNFAGSVEYHHGHLHKPHILIWDHKLRREHIYLKVHANDMDNENSLYTGVNGIEYEHEHIRNNKHELKDVIRPPMGPNNWLDWHQEPYEFDLTGGGFIDFGDYHEDFLRAKLHYGEVVLSRKCVQAVGKGSAYIGGKILCQWMREKEFEAKNYEQHEPQDYTNKKFEEEE